ncbi:hypothetical protein B0T16DRAFT_394019 [Cercophora newfieldiana]|uniref:Ankyrin n=1 Tax=Cercophora newfieldiana TaxID=92897 RepID=A0AA40CK20_9PEZI|nr:hypothetical protein B0T16DRAFT_394019 [Cercophora newfieldiana]
MAPLFTLLSPSSLATTTAVTLITYTQHPDKTITLKHGHNPTPKWPTTPLAIRIGIEDQEYNDGAYAGFPSGDTSPNLVFDLAPKTQSHFLRLLNLLLRKRENSPARNSTVIPSSPSVSALQAADEEMFSQTGISAIGNACLRQVLVLVALRGAVVDASAYDAVVRYLAESGEPPERPSLSFEIDQNMAALPISTEAALVRKGWWTPRGFHASNYGLWRLWGRTNETEETWKELFDAMVQAGYFHGDEWKYTREAMKRSVVKRVAEVGAVGLMEYVLDALPLGEMDKGVECDLLCAAVSNGVEMMEFLLDRGLDPNLVDDRVSSYRGWPSTTALHVAVESGKAEVVKLLLERGVKMIEMYGSSPLQLASRQVDREPARETRKEVLQLLESCLRERGLPLNHVDKPTFLPGTKRPGK